MTEWSALLRFVCFLKHAFDKEKQTFRFCKVEPIDCESL